MAPSPASSDVSHVDSSAASSPRSSDLGGGRGSSGLAAVQWRVAQATYMDVDDVVADVQRLFGDVLERMSEDDPLQAEILQLQASFHTDLERCGSARAASSKRSADPYCCMPISHTSRSSSHHHQQQWQQCSLGKRRATTDSDIWSHPPAKYHRDLKKHPDFDDEEIVRLGSAERLALRSLVEAGAGSRDVQHDLNATRAIQQLRRRLGPKKHRRAKSLLGDVPRGPASRWMDWPASRKVAKRALKSRGKAKAGGGRGSRSALLGAASVLKAAAASLAVAAAAAAAGGEVALHGCVEGDCGSIGAVSATTPSTDFRLVEGGERFSRSFAADGSESEDLLWLSEAGGASVGEEVEELRARSGWASSRFAAELARSDLQWLELAESVRRLGVPALCEALVPADENGTEFSSALPLSEMKDHTAVGGVAGEEKGFWVGAAVEKRVAAKEDKAQEEEDEAKEDLEVEREVKAEDEEVDEKDRKIQQGMVAEGDWVQEEEKATVEGMAAEELAEDEQQAAGDGGTECDALQFSDVEALQGLSSVEEKEAVEVLASFCLGFADHSPVLAVGGDAPDTPDAPDPSDSPDISDAPDPPDTCDTTDTPHDAQAAALGPAAPAEISPAPARTGAPDYSQLPCCEAVTNHECFAGSLANDGWREGDGGDLNLGPREDGSRTPAIRSSSQSPLAASVHSAGGRKSNLKPEPPESACTASLECSWAASVENPADSPAPVFTVASVEKCASSHTPQPQTCVVHAAPSEVQQEPPDPPSRSARTHPSPVVWRKAGSPASLPVPAQRTASPLPSLSPPLAQFVPAPQHPGAALARMAAAAAAAAAGVRPTETSIPPTLTAAYAPPQRMRQTLQPVSPISGFGLPTFPHPRAAVVQGSPTAAWNPFLGAADSTGNHFCSVSKSDPAAGPRALMVGTGPTCARSRGTTWQLRTRLRSGAYTERASARAVAASTGCYGAHDVQQQQQQQQQQLLQQQLQHQQQSDLSLRAAAWAGPHAVANPGPASPCIPRVVRQACADASQLAPSALFWSSGQPSTGSQREGCWQQQGEQLWHSALQLPPVPSQSEQLALSDEHTEGSSCARTSFTYDWSQRQKRQQKNQHYPQQHLEQQPLPQPPPPQQQQQQQQQQQEGQQQQQDRQQHRPQPPQQQHPLQTSPGLELGYPQRPQPVSVVVCSGGSLGPSYFENVSRQAGVQFMCMDPPSSTQELATATVRPAFIPPWNIAPSPCTGHVPLASPQRAVALWGGLQKPLPSLSPRGRACAVQASYLQPKGPACSRATGVFVPPQGTGPVCTFKPVTAVSKLPAVQVTVSFVASSAQHPTSAVA